MKSSGVMLAAAAALCSVGAVLAGPSVKAPSVPVTAEVNAARQPERVPQGAGEFEIERPRPTGGATVRATDFGFSETNPCNASAVMRALDYCRRTGAARLELAAGTYSCFDADHGLIVAEMKDFVLDGKGAMLVFRRPTRRLFANSDRILTDSNLLVSNCLRTVVRNFRMDWDWATDPLCDVGVVVGTHVDEADNASYIDLDLPDYPDGHPWFGRPMPIQTMTPINASRDRLTGEAPNRLLFGLTEGHFGSKMAWLSKNRIRLWPGVRDPGRFCAPIAEFYYGADINRRTAAAVATGVNYRLFHYYYGKGGITLDAARHVTVEDVDIISCFGMPIVVSGATSYSQFVRITSEPKPGRPCTGTSDGCHIARSQGHIKFIGCRLSMQNDDGFNWHDCFTIGVPDGARRLKVTNLRGAKYLEATDGDELELLRWDFRPLGWTGRLVRTEGDCLVVDRDLPPLEGEHFLIYDNTYRSDYILMRDCVWHDTHCRELIQPNHVTVENCRFVRTGSGLKLGSAHSREFWCEGKGAKDVVFRNCTFEHTNTLLDWCKGGDGPEFETYVKFPRPKPYPPGNNVFTTKLPPDFDLGFHRDFLIEKCRFVDPAGSLFVGNPIVNLIFRDNVIELTGERRRLPMTGSFRFGAVRDVFITGNRYRLAPSVKEPFAPKIVGDVPGLVVRDNRIERGDPSSWPFLTIRQTSTAIEKGERFKEIIAASARHPGSVDEYWLCFNAGPSLANAQARMERWKPFLPLLEAAHITSGSQQGVTLGHSKVDAEPGVFSDDAWQVGRKGRRLTVLCPRSPEVLAYEADLVERAVRTMKLGSVWLDDDLRMGGSKEEGCFCDRCLAAFNREYGLNVTREELVARLDSKEPKEELRRRWRLFKNLSLAVYGAAARRGADRVSPDVRLGYQSIDAQFVTAGENYLPLMKALAGTNGVKSAIRVGSGNYYESLPENYRKSFSVMREAERCRKAGFVAQISYEQETYTREVLHKSAEAVLIESAMALAAGADALTEYWWTASRDEPTSYFEEFSAMLVEWRPYLESLAAISRETSIAGLARFRGGDHLTVPSCYLGDEDDFAFGSMGIPMTVDDSPRKVWYVNAHSLNEWGPGDAERLAAKGAVVDKAVWQRLLACGGEPVARAAREGRLVPFDFTLAKQRQRTSPTHAERAAFLDAIGKVAALPVRIERAHPLFVFPRVDADGRVRAVSLFNGSVGRCLPTDVVIRNPAAETAVWRRPGESPRSLAVEKCADGLKVRIPGIPGAHVGTLSF